MAGTLTIHSSGTGELLSGHSWIEFRPDGGKATTYGTWGNNPTGQGNGLFQDLELGRPSDASRSVHLTDAQEQRLNDTVAKYRAKGTGAWGYLSPCSTFAAEAWENASGEGLSHRSGIISNPSKLKLSIAAANANDQAKAAAHDPMPAPKRPPSSRRVFGTATQPCSLR